MYIHYHQELVEQQRFKSLFKALGVLWQKSELEVTDDIKETDDVFIPLSMVINPKILDVVKANQKTKTKTRVMGDGTPIDTTLGPVKSMGDLSKEEFYRLIGQAMPSKLPTEAKKEMEKKWVKNG